MSASIVGTTEVATPAGSTVALQIDPVAGPAQSSLKVTFRSSAGQPVTVDINSGQYFAAGRRMLGPGGAYLSYELYSDPALTQPWSAQNLTGQGLGVDVPVFLYVRIPPQPDAPLGTYSDELALSVSY